MMRLAFTPRLAMALLMYPALSIASAGSSPTVFLAVIVGLMALHSVGGVAPALLVLNAFPASVRGTGFSISMALAITLFGGTAQIVFTWIIASTGEKLSFIYYVIGMNLVTVAACLLMLRHLKRRGGLSSGNAITDPDKLCEEAADHPRARLRS
jgi:hypothetical protein